MFRIDHAGPVYARTKNGLVDLKVDDHGLFCRIDLGQTASAREIYENIKIHNYYQMSFAFPVNEESYDQKTHTRKILGIDKLYDVSAVSFPANPDTEIDIATRSYLDGVIEAEKAERLEREKREIQKQKIRILSEVKI